MKYQAFDGEHILLLSMDETDQFFDPFDPMDSDIPSHLYHQRHRYIKDDTYAWLVANVGQPQVDWTHFRSSLDCRGFQFKNGDKAMLFKLTFSEGSNNGTVD